MVAMRIIRGVGISSEANDEGCTGGLNFLSLILTDIDIADVGNGGRLLWIWSWS